MIDLCRGKYDRYVPIKYLYACHTYRNPVVLQAEHLVPRLLSEGTPSNPLGKILPGGGGEEGTDADGHTKCSSFVLFLTISHKGFYVTPGMEEKHIHAMFHSSG